MEAPASGKSPVSILVTTRDEEGVIGAALDSVAWADEVLVVDSGSRDRTVDIARAKGARVLEHPYESPARQKNWALPQCRREWVLILDADERVTPELARSVQEIVAGGAGADGYWVRRRNFFLGRPLRHGDWGRDTVIRLVRRDRARYQDRLVHEEIDLAGPLPMLSGLLDHDAFRSFAQYWPKVWRYADLGAEDLARRGRRGSAAAVLGHTLWRLTRGYVLRRGFLNGACGLLAALLDASATFLKYARLWEKSWAGARNA